MQTVTRIVFMGTPEFAVASLDALHKSENKIAGVITAPDKPAGRGNKLHISAVKKYAVENNIEPVLQPTNLKDPEFIKELAALEADLFVVVAFRMLPEIVWSMPKLGTINLHASLLPQYRGAAPINWAIINGEKATGITTFFIEKEIDTGHIIMQEKVDILHEDNAGSLHNTLMMQGAELIAKTVQTIKKGFYEAVPQQKIEGKSILRPAPKIFKDDCRIKWEKPVKEVHNLIRGLSPYPGAWTEMVGINGQNVVIKIFESEIGDTNIENKRPPSTIVYQGVESMQIVCSNGFIKIKSLQLAGRSKMDIQSFLRGFKEQENYTSVS